MSHESFTKRLAGLNTKIAIARIQLEEIEVERNTLLQEMRQEWEKKVGDMVPVSVRDNVWRTYVNDLQIAPSSPQEISSLESEASRALRFNSSLPERSGNIRIPSQPPKSEKARLDTLVDAGYLTENQTLYFRMTNGKPCPGARYESRISGNSLIHTETGHSYSMTSLARLLRQDFGNADVATRGPMYWYTEAGASVKDLWDRFLRNAGR